MELLPYCIPLLNGLSVLQVIDRIINDVLPVVRQSGLAGHAEYITKSDFFVDHPIAVDMLVDIMTDRGFHVCYVREEIPTPTRINLDHGVIICDREVVHKFKISFERKGVRDDLKVSQHKEAW